MPLVDTAGHGPVRCTRCHAYMNAFCRFVEVRETPFLRRHLILKIFNLPRQARDKHKGEHSKQEWRFLVEREQVDLLHVQPRGEKTGFLSHLYIKVIILPRQARDKHMQSTQTNPVLLQNETVEHYFNHLDMHGYRIDRNERPELSKGTVDYVATETYIARPPMRPAFLFVVDVSPKALQSGLMRQVTETLKMVVSVLPKHTRLGLITYDDTVQFHVLAAEGDTLHKMLVATDVDDPFCPHGPEALMPPVGERCAKRLF